METVAYHEAGHALMAWRAGARIQSITIDPDWDDGPDRQGDARVIWDRSQYQPKDYVRKAVAVALAGPVAEMIYTGDPFHPAQVSAWSMDWQVAWTVASEIHSSRQACALYLEQAVRDLYQLLNSEPWWSAIAALADHLEAWETLEHEQVDEIASHWFD